MINELELYSAASQEAWNKKQMVGENIDYYVTLEQLMELIRGLMRK